MARYKFYIVLYCIELLLPNLKHCIVFICRSIMATHKWHGLVLTIQFTLVNWSYV